MPKHFTPRAHTTLPSFLIALLACVILPMFTQARQTQQPQLPSQAPQVELTGRVTHALTGEPVPGASVQIPQLGRAFRTDDSGKFAVKGLRPGTIQVVFSAVSFEPNTLPVEILPGRTATLHAMLVPKSEQLSAVVVSAGRRTQTSQALIGEIRQSRAVVSGISRQQIALSQDNHAAQAMQRVPGVTVVDNRFVMVRGLGERYNQVLINDLPAPSTEVDKRSFSFDLIPSGALDRMVLHKSGSAENPGDFAGAVIKVYTNHEVSGNFFQISAGSGFRLRTSFQPFFQSQGSKLDFLGLDDGFRLLPTNFPTTARLQQEPRSSLLRQAAGRVLPNNWKAEESTALPDLKLGLSLGRRFMIGKLQVSNLTAFDIAQSYQSYTRDFTRYFEYDADRPGQVDPRFAFTDRIYEKQNRLTLMSNFLIRIHPQHEIRFSNLFNQIGENETNLRSGEDFIQDLGWRRHYLLGYRSRSIYTGQVQGRHNLPKAKKLRWVLGGNMLLENEPDLRRFRTYAGGVSQNGKTSFIMITPPSSNLFDASRYYGQLREYALKGGADFTRQFAGPRGASSEWKLGYFIGHRYRSFQSRYMSFLIPGHVSPQRKAELESLPLEQIFAREQIQTRDGLVLEEGTRPQDSYTASSLQHAAYVSLAMPFGAITASGGLRAEYNLQQLDSYQNLSPVRVYNPVWSLLPSINLMFAFSERAQFRLGYGKTVNRPEFRELAPFNFYDFRLDANRTGEPGLKTATISNIDLRYEFYPRSSESISVGSFFKYFRDPVENRSIITSELPTYTYINARNAFNYGIELEVRKRLDQFFRSRFWQRFSVNLNATYLYSLVELGEVASAQQKQRPLQGQSPYILNAILGYDELSGGLAISAGYNMMGRRLFAVGDLNNPDIWEMPRHSLDLTISKRFKAFILKAGVQDLLSYRYRFMQDTDRNGSLRDAVDRPVFEFQKGSLINLTLTFKI